MQRILKETRNRDTEQSAHKDIDIEDKDSREDPESLDYEIP